MQSTQTVALFLHIGLSIKCHIHNLHLGVVFTDFNQLGSISYGRSPASLAGTSHWYPDDLTPATIMPAPNKSMQNELHTPRRLSFHQNSYSQWTLHLHVILFFLSCSVPIRCKDIIVVWLMEVTHYMETIKICPVILLSHWNNSILCFVFESFYSHFSFVINWSWFSLNSWFMVWRNNTSFGNVWI